MPQKKMAYFFKTHERFLSKARVHFQYNLFFMYRL